MHLSPYKIELKATGAIVIVPIQFCCNTKICVLMSRGTSHNLKKAITIFLLIQELVQEHKIGCSKHLAATTGRSGPVIMVIWHLYMKYNLLTLLPKDKSNYH